MTKKQKIWLWIFIAMFVVPEIFWSPVTNFYYELTQTNQGGGTRPFNYNFLQNSDNVNYLKTTIFIQLLGVVLFIMFWFKNKNKINSKVLFWTVFLLALLICLVSLFALYFFIAFNPIFP